MAKARFCEICKDPIDPERVEVIPDTHLCTRHAHEIQQFGGEFRLITHQERTSKVGSLKKNFGGVSARKVRNNEAMRKLREAQARSKSKAVSRQSASASKLSEEIGKWEIHFALPPVDAENYDADPILNREPY